MRKPSPPRYPAPRRALGQSRGQPGNAPEDPPWPTETDRFTAREALFYHETIRPGKIEIIAVQADGDPARPAAWPIRPASRCRSQAIAEDPGTAYDYTAKGNLVAVISNGTAILGMGNLGALASKPVMEGKAVLFKRFADVDSIDIELDTEDPRRSSTRSR